MMMQYIVCQDVITLYSELITASFMEGDLQNATKRRYFVRRVRLGLQGGSNWFSHSSSRDSHECLRAKSEDRRTKSEGRRPETVDWRMKSEEQRAKTEEQRAKNGR